MHSRIDTITRRTFDVDASLVLVGVRGCGKRSVGFIAAAGLKRRLITQDYYFKEVTGLTRHEYLLQHGNQDFRSRDVEVLIMMLDNHRTRCVIECGLASLTRPVQHFLRGYCLTNPVVYLLRDPDCVQSFLGLKEKAARSLRESDAMHRTCSNFEFYNVEDRSLAVVGTEKEENVDRRSADYSFKLKDVQEDFTRFIRLVTGADIDDSAYDSPFVLLDTPPEVRSYTHAIFVRTSDLIGGSVDLARLESGGDAIELCVDRWGSDLPSIVSRHVALLRRNARTPIILSVDISSCLTGNVSQTRNIYLEILEHGLRLAVEYLVVDLSQDQEILNRVIQGRGRTKIIGHCLFEPSPSVSWEDEGCVSLYLEAEKLGCQLVRILRVATEREDNGAVASFTNKIQSLPGVHPPLIAYNVGDLGRTSQVFNPILTSVTHPAIQRCPGDFTERKTCLPQITAQDAVRALFSSYVLDSLNFYIIGGSVAYSLSPAMHNAAYRHCGMTHTYRIPDYTTLAALDQLCRDPHFGGASVVQPFRVEVFGKLAAKSRHAEAIGAINTVLPLRARADGSLFPLQEQAKRRNQAGRVLGWYGDNTDWVGIMKCISRNLSPRNAIRPLKTTGLVIGAGGMARAAIFAMLQLGCRNIFIYNRTLDRAESVALHFNSWVSSFSGDAVEVVRVLPSAQAEWPSDASPPTLIASCVPADPTASQPPANFEMPVQWLQSPTGGVVLELAYKPVDTPLLKQMRRICSETSRPWVLVDGLENVTEQGIAQWELLTGRKAPRRLMTLEVLRNYVGEDGRHFDEKTIQARMKGIYYASSD